MLAAAQMGWLRRPVRAKDADGRRLQLTPSNRTVLLDDGREQVVSEQVLNLSTCGGAASATSRFALLPAVLSPLVAERLALQASALTFDTRPDSVDREPAHELYLTRDGVVLPGARGLDELTRPSVASITHLVNQLHPKLCAGRCVACTSLG